MQLVQEPMQPILVLGHGQVYQEKNKFTGCWLAPRHWLSLAHLSVDRNPAVKPNLVYDLQCYPWTFASDASFGTVIDATGTTFFHMLTPLIIGGPLPKWGYDREFIDEVQRVLKPGGTFYGARVISKPLTPTISSAL